MAELAILAGSIGTAISEGVAAAGAALGTAATAVGGAEAVLPLIGTGLTVAGTIGAGAAARNEAEFAAREKERQATEEQAVASRESEDQRRKTATILSRQKAVAASSGAGVTNPTIFDIMSETAQEGDYVARSITASGANRAAGLRDQAAADRYRGRAAYQGSILEGLGEGVTGIYKAKKSKYG